MQLNTRQQMWLHLPVVKLVCVQQRLDCNRCAKKDLVVRHECLIATSTLDTSYHWCQWCEALPPRPAEDANVALSCSSNVKLLVLAKAITQRSLWQIPCHNVMPMITPHTPPTTMQKTKQFSQEADKLACLLKAANRGIVFIFSQRVFDNYPEKLHVFWFWDWQIFDNNQICFN